MSIIADGNQKRIDNRVFGMRSVMECPWCKGYYPEYTAKKQTWKFDKWVIPNKRARYICGHCKHGVQYDMS